MAPFWTSAPPDMTETEFNEWLSIDADVGVSQPLSDSDIITEIQQTSQTNDDDSSSEDEGDEERDERVSRKQTTEALKTLRCALEQCGGVDDEKKLTITSCNLTSTAFLFL